MDEVGEPVGFQVRWGEGVVEISLGRAITFPPLVDLLNGGKLDAWNDCAFAGRALDCPRNFIPGWSCRVFVTAGLQCANVLTHL